MIDKIETSQVPEPLEKSSAKQHSPASPVPKNDTDVSVQVDYASLIEQATKPLQTDAEVTQRARLLLKSGELESLESIMEAVKYMLRYGI